MNCEGLSKLDLYNFFLKATYCIDERSTRRFCYFCLIHHKGPGTCVVAFRDVVLCFTMLNGQMPFVCFLFNPVFVRTIFSEAALINNGCAAHVSALLIFYAAAAPTTLSALLGR